MTLKNEDSETWEMYIVSKQVAFNRDLQGNEKKLQGNEICNDAVITCIYCYMYYY